MPNYATIAEPLFALLSKKVTFRWSKDAEQSFRAVKNSICTSRVLHQFDPSRPTFVTSDASDKGAGALLSQSDSSGREYAISFWSQRFSQAEKKYSVTEKETLAAVRAVEHWKLFLWGHRFTLRTDHSALKSILSSKSTGRAGARVSRWQARLMVYSYDIQHVPGKKLPCADALSRLPVDKPTNDDELNELIATVQDGTNSVVHLNEVKLAT